MKEQNYANHTRFMPLYHYFTTPLLLLVFILAAMGLVHAMNTGDILYAGIMPLLVAVVLILLFMFVRGFALKVQDRTIRAEENLRHYVLTGKLLDPRLSMSQIIALRFAPDEEYLPLIDQAISNNMSSTDIKKAVKNWKADHHRA